ncbi:hypothetical protein NA57DRAFT_45478 [Rhizodiscina lignyota]|uniref:Cell wall mannoprotein PIR1-like C-terminal domain-containing protein n=1 Tax=Rhizodiscina lignyota TaxID=1504668 RepID=A0A9P4M2M6_9PEZI|nr:hypothetical protein NA57DRAFT_45478 [Rhizodiscina lignyota]
MPQGVTSVISAGSAPSGCDVSHSGSFAITVQNVSSSSTKRSIEERQTSGILTLTLEDGVLKDQAGRTGYIASNFQFQFDKPPQTGAIFTAGFSLCSNQSLAHGGSAIWYQCKSGDFFNLYDRHWAAQCNAIYIEALLSGPAPTTGAVSQISDGQPQATTAAAVSQISDGQPQAASGTPVSQISDGQPQAATSAAVSEAPEGQPQATTASPVSQISDGQPQAPTGTPVTQISDGQPQAPTGTPVTQISDGQPQAATGSPVSEASEGQPQVTTTAAAAGTGSVTPASNGTFTTSASPTLFTGAAAPVRLGQEILGAAIGIMGAVALL